MPNSVARMLSVLGSLSLPAVFLGFIVLFLLSLGMLWSPEMTTGLIAPHFSEILTIFELISPGIASALSLFLIALLLSMIQ